MRNMEHKLRYLKISQQVNTQTNDHIAQYLTKSDRKLQVVKYSHIHLYWYYNTNQEHSCLFLDSYSYH